MPGVAQELALRVKHNERGIGLHDIGLGKKARFAGAATAADQHVQIPAVHSPVHADGYILRQQLIVCWAFSCHISAADCGWPSPFGRAVFFAAAGIPGTGQRHSDTQPIESQKNKDRFQAVPT